VLTQTLRGLERDGLLTLTVHATVPPRVNHEPTNLGRTLHARSRPYRMALGHMADVLAAREAYDAQHARPRRLTDAAGQQCRSVPAG
jgi:DNA-binding HxlR family transcriptional regulator